MKSQEVKIIEDFFFEGMLKGGYADPDSKPIKDLILFSPAAELVHALKGSKCVFYSKTVYLDKENTHPVVMTLVDLWFSRKDSDFSGGMTLIWVDKELVWMMNYGGHYLGRAIPILKLALKTLYEKKEFHGCRGGRFFKNGTYIYYNQYTGSFENFYGHEEIIEKEPGISSINCGEHYYHGFLLAPIEKD